MHAAFPAVGLYGSAFDVDFLCNMFKDCGCYVDACVPLAECGVDRFGRLRWAEV